MNWTDDRGVSLIELVLVMVLVGIVIGIAVPSIRPERFKLDAAAIHVVTMLNAQQRAAVLRQHNVVLAFDTVEGLIRVHYDEDNDNTIDSNENWHVVELEDAVTYGLGGADPRPMSALSVSLTEEQDDLPSLTFRINGSASEEGIIYVTSIRSIAETSGVDTRAIEIDRATGRTRCYSYQSAMWVEGC